MGAVKSKPAVIWEERYVLKSLRDFLPRRGKLLRLGRHPALLARGLLLLYDHAWRPGVCHDGVVVAKRCGRLQGWRSWVRTL
jgi:hypothetical protein